MVCETICAGHAVINQEMHTVDENRYQYFFGNHEYQALLREAEQAQLVAYIRRLQRKSKGIYPLWLVVLLSRLSAALIASGTHLQDQLAKAGSLQPPAGEQPHQYSYGD
jgi:hypothetical protein